MIIDLFVLTSLYARSSVHISIETNIMYRTTLPVTQQQSGLNYEQFKATLIDTEPSLQTADVTMKMR